MSQLGQNRPRLLRNGTSEIPQKADILSACRHVSNVPYQKPAGFIRWAGASECRGRLIGFPYDGLWRQAVGRYRGVVSTGRRNTLS